MPTRLSKIADKLGKIWVMLLFAAAPVAMFFFDYRTSGSSGAGDSDVLAYGFLRKRWALEIYRHRGFGETKCRTTAPMFLSQLFSRVVSSGLYRRWRLVQ